MASALGVVATDLFSAKSAAGAINATARKLASGVVPRAMKMV